MNINSQELTSLEKKTFKFHLIYSILEGIVVGVLALNEYVFIRSLRGSPYLLAFLIQFSVVVFLLLIFTNEFLKRAKNKRKMLQKVALITRVPLILILLFPKNVDVFITNPYYHYIFLALFLVFYLESPVTYPTTNLFLRRNYSHEHFSRLFSFALSIYVLVSLIVTFVYGVLLDLDPYAFTYILPVIAVIGVLSIFSLAKIDYFKEDTKLPSRSLLGSVKESTKNMYLIVKNNKPFRNFQIGFMFYGFAYMMMLPVTTLFFQQVLNLNYSSVAFYKNSFNLVAVLLIPLFGKLIEKIDPRKFAAFTFLLIAFSIIFLALTEFYQNYVEIFGVKLYFLLILYILFFGIFTGMMTLLWRIGSVYFCKDEDVDIYQSVHLSATGIRGAIAPLLGVFFLEFFGFFTTFLIVILTLFFTIAIMIWSYKTEKIVNS